MSIKMRGKNPINIGHVNYWSKCYATAAGANCISHTVMWVSYDSDSSINYKSFATVKKNLQTNFMEIYLANILLTFQDEKPQDFERVVITGKKTGFTVSSIQWRMKLYWIFWFRNIMTLGKTFRKPQPQKNTTLPNPSTLDAGSAADNWLQARWPPCL